MLINKHTFPSGMKSYFLTTLLLTSFTSFVSAVTDENICDVQCEFCCREKVCKSKDDCEGNFSPFIILGAVAGGLIGLIVLRKLYVYLRGKNPQQKEGAGKNKSRSRSRSSKPKKEKKDTKSANKPLNKANKASKTRSREDVTQKPEEVYLQIDNESIVGVDSNKPDQEQNKGQNQNLLSSQMKSSKGEISSKSRLEADENKANTQRSDKKRDNSAPKGKTSTKPGTGKPGSSSKKPGTGSKGGSSKPGTSGERGRSAGPGGKERANSQPKKSGGTSGNNGDKGKTGKK